MYTCAYWSEGTRTLEQAQRNKIDHVCRKIRLEPGERFVDIGCGFGGFMFRAHADAGCGRHGINTTPEQVSGCTAEIARHGLADELEVRRPISARCAAQYDKVVSIGVLEHAGRDQLAEVIAAHADFLKPGGLGMLHFIGHVGASTPSCSSASMSFPAAGSPAWRTRWSRWSVAGWRWSTSRTCAATTR